MSNPPTSNQSFSPVEFIANATKAGIAIRVNKSKTELGKVRWVELIAERVYGDTPGTAETRDLVASLRDLIRSIPPAETGEWEQLPSCKVEGKRLRVAFPRLVVDSAVLQRLAELGNPIGEQMIRGWELDVGFDALVEDEIQEAPEVVRLKTLVAETEARLQETLAAERARREGFRESHHFVADDRAL